jgi:hypothetical protein
VESSCELGNEPSGSIKCWELPNGCTTCGLSSGTQLHIVIYIYINSVAFSPQANYTDWATTTGRRISVPTFGDRGVLRRTLDYRGNKPVQTNVGSKFPTSGWPGLALINMKYGAKKAYHTWSPCYFTFYQRMLKKIAFSL